MTHFTASDPASFASGYKPLLNVPSFKHDRPADRALTLAREVRNPLTSINLSLDMLKAAITDPELKVYIDIISRSSWRINQQVNQLLKYQEIASPEQTNY